MQSTIKRREDINSVQKLISLFPVTAILGPRQCGKTVLANQMNYNHYFDLENPRDLAALEQPQLALEKLEGLIVIDEIQRIPNLFGLIRYLVDTNSNQKYLILGSASRELIRQSSETMAGRIAYYNLGGFSIADIGTINIKRLWLTGGFPRAYLAESIENGFVWLENYIRTFLERDIPQLGISIPAHTLHRFWTMISHYHGQVINFSEIGRSFGISDVTVRNYMDILEGTFMIRILHPWHSNTKKRLVKRPKIYIRDSGIFHSLMDIGSEKTLLSHNKLGASWEGFAVETICKILSRKVPDIYFWSTHTHAEVDLFWKHGEKNWAVEFKYSDAPKLTKSMQIAVHDLELERLWVVYPGDKRYTLSPKVETLPISDVKEDWEYID